MYSSFAVSACQACLLKCTVLLEASKDVPVQAGTVLWHLPVHGILGSVWSIQAAMG